MEHRSCPRTLTMWHEARFGWCVFCGSSLWHDTPQPGSTAWVINMAQNIQQTLGEMLSENRKSRSKWPGILTQLVCAMYTQGRYMYTYWWCKKRSNFTNSTEQHWLELIRLLKVDLLIERVGSSVRLVIFTQGILQQYKAVHM